MCSPSVRVESPPDERPATGLDDYLGQPPHDGPQPATVPSAQLAESPSELDLESILDEIAPEIHAAWDWPL